MLAQPMLIRLTRPRHITCGKVMVVEQFSGPALFHSRIGSRPSELTARPAAFSRSGLQDGPDCKTTQTAKRPTRQDVRLNDAMKNHRYGFRPGHDPAATAIIIIIAIITFTPKAEPVRCQRQSPINSPPPSPPLA
jgi:hypothetical protein